MNPTNPTASIVVPTRERPDYLEVALASIAPQAAAAGAEALVVHDDPPSPAIRAIAERFGAGYLSHTRPLGLNAARNTGVANSRGELVVFVDDDVEVRPGWLEALLRAAREHPRAQVFTGPIHPRLEGDPPRSCGREGPPITALDLGPEDTDRVRYAWGANMTVRRCALERVGPFDTALAGGGDEQEWQERLRSRGGDEGDFDGGGSAFAHGDDGSRSGRGNAKQDGREFAHGDDGSRSGRGNAKQDGREFAHGDGRIVYVAAAALDHRRSPADARLRPLARAARARGRASRRFDAWRGEAPSLPRELRTLAGCLGHVVRRRCPAGLTMAAHSFGRIEEAVRERGGAPPAARAGVEEDFLSGESGTVGGFDALRRGIQDELIDARELLDGRRLRLERAVRRSPPRRRVLVLGVERPERRELAAAIRAELERSRHDVELHVRPPGGLGKFENLNRLLAAHPAEGYDWVIALDDDVVLPRGFLDRLLFLAERFDFQLLQPAHRARSHAAWGVTRRRAGAVARETPFVEIGPVTAFGRATFPVLLPFPEVRMGWGLDLHWAALARQNGWRCGVLDAVAIRHCAAPAGSAYSRQTAVAEARALLAERPYLKAREAQTTLVTHRRW